MNGISNDRLMGERYKNYVKLSSHFLTSIFCILHSRWNVFMVSRQQVQHLFVVCFGSVAKRPVASLFDTVKTVICLRGLSRLAQIVSRLEMFTLADTASNCSFSTTSVLVSKQHKTLLYPMSFGT